MKTFVLVSSLFALAAVASAQEFNAGTPTLVDQFQLGVPETHVGTNAAGAVVYKNLLSFTGSGFAQGASVGGINRLVCDDLQCTAGGINTVRVTWSTANFNPAAVNARMRLRFFADNAGVPGAAITGFSFNPVALSGVQLWFADIAVAIPAGGKIWAGEVFDNVGTTATDAQIANLGQGLFDPVNIGSSADVAWEATTPGSNLVNNPVGATFNFGGSPKANFGWQLEVVPEPTSMIALGIGALGLLARRRRKA